MKIKTWHPYYIVDFKRCSMKATLEIEDCEEKELIDLCMKTFREFRNGSEGSGKTIMKIRRVDCKTNRSTQFVSVPLYNKTPFQFRKMLLEQINS